MRSRASRARGTTLLEHVVDGVIHLGPLRRIHRLQASLRVVPALLELAGTRLGACRVARPDRRQHVFRDLLESRKVPERRSGGGGTGRGRGGGGGSGSRCCGGGGSLARSGWQRRLSAEI